MERGFGIQTLLMTDVVGSTRLWSEQPQAMPHAIERLEALAEAAIGGEGGEVVKRRGEGDSHFCVLPNPAAAARAATALQRSLNAGDSPEGIHLHLRAAIHCGPAHTRGPDLLGPVPNRCARLREVGHGDQILLSGAARAQLTASDGIGVRELGRHRLRDLDEPESIYQVLADGLPAEFPPLRSLTCLRNNLPTQYTSFVGREALRRELMERLVEDRLTTLTGAGGSGKTRLSLQVGAESIDAFPDGVWFVELAEFATEAAVVRAIGDVCGHRDLPDADALNALAARLAAHGKALFLIDNAEHALGIIGRVVAGLLGAVPELHVLATSREPLRLRGEHVHRLPPLSVPPAGCTDPDIVAETEAGALFLDRARLRLPEFSIRESNAKAVCEIVRRLDGIPLCLEMAASHVGYLGPDQIASRLHDRFSLLEDDVRNGPARHRTMREAIAWQYDTLREEERLLLQRLAVFAGGFTLDAAEAVGGTPPLDPDSVLRHLRALIDKSLVVATPDGGEMRYRLLETIAQFASDQVERETEAAMEPLFRWVSSFAVASYSELYGPEHDKWVAKLDHFSATTLRSLDWAIAGSEPEVGTTVYSLARYWHFRGLFGLGRGYLEAAHAKTASSLLRGDIRNAVAVFSSRLGDNERAEILYRELLDSEELEPASRAKATGNYAILLNERGNLGEALSQYQLAERLATQVGDAYTLRLLRYNRALCLMDSGQPEQAKKLLEQVLEEYRVSGDTKRVGQCLEAQASASVLLDDVEAASQYIADAIRAAGSDPDAQFLADVLLDTAWIAARCQKLEIADRMLRSHDEKQRQIQSPITRRNTVKRGQVLLALPPTDWGDDSDVASRNDQILLDSSLRAVTEIRNYLSTLTTQTRS